jgi:predicted aspartyl protease
MGRFSLEFKVLNNQDLQMAQRGALDPTKVRSTTIKGLVDSGATYLVLPEYMASLLGLPSAGEVMVRYADQRSSRRKAVGEVGVELLGRRGTFRAILEPERETALIGALVLEDLDLMVDCSRQELRPRDPGGIVAELE